MFYSGGALPQEMLPMVLLVGGLSALALLWFFLYLKRPHKHAKPPTNVTDPTAHVRRSKSHGRKKQHKRGQH